MVANFLFAIKYFKCATAILLNRKQLVYVVLSVAFVIRVADFHFRLTQYAPKCFLCSMVNIVYRKWEEITEELQYIYIY